MRDSLGARMQTVKVPGPAGPYEVPLHRASLQTRFLQGAALVGGLTALRLVPQIGKNFTVLQALLGLASASFGGGLGGVVYYSTDRLRIQGGARRTFANVISLLAYAFATVGVLLLLAHFFDLE
jgi:hypothetical protein